MDENIGAGTSDWFNNITTVVAGFVATGQDDNDWLLTVDANILVAVQDGYVAYLGYYNGPQIDDGSGADLWQNFFIALQDASVTQDDLIEDWGRAEQAGTNEGLNRADALGLEMGVDDEFFTWIGNQYRASGNLCQNPRVNCATFLWGFFDPRTIWWPGFSPVGYAELPVYFFDRFGYVFTGH